MGKQKLFAFAISLLFLLFLFPTGANSQESGLNNEGDYHETVYKEVVWQPHTIILGKDSASKLISISPDDTLTFSEITRQLAELQTGNIIIKNGC